MLYQFIRKRTVLSALLLAMAAVSCVSAIAESAAPSTPTNQIVVATKMNGSFGSRSTVSLTLPADVNRSTIHAELNGKDISSRLSASACEQGTCLTGTVSSADGLRMGKNVVYATAHTEQGRLVTGRSRFFQGGTSLSSPGSGRPRANAVTANLSDSSSSSGFLPPTVTFQTLYSGGWTGASPWFQVGDQKYPRTAPCPSGTIYLILEFDRQTLNPSKWGAGGGCASSGTDLASQLSQIPKNDLVVVGTLSGTGSDASLDTSSIGGTNYAGAKNPPAGYVAIGVAGATSGAYENYAVDPKGDNTLVTPMWPFATGIVQEDQDGNYNYESSEVLEYTVDPFTQDPSADHPGTITIGPSLAQSLANPALKGYRFLPPAISSGSHRGGFWLVVVRRDVPSCNNLSSNCTQTPAPDPNDGLVRITNAGTLYYTGDLDATTHEAAFQSLANDLKAIGPYDLAFLSTFTIGSGSFPICCGDPWELTGNTTWTDSGGAPTPNPSNPYSAFRNALEALGGSGRATLFYDFGTSQWNTNPEYTYVFSRGSGDPLAGNSAVSASAYAATGQTGYIHGVLARNTSGLFQPYQTSQQQDSAHDAASGPDYLMTKLSTLQPIAWPELSGTLLSGASSVAGQEAAYHYASYMLLMNYYIKGVAGNYLDDIHYFFTGSNANYINYHYFDPVNLPAPAFSNGQYCWPGPTQDPYASPVCFTPADFAAVTNQLSAEVVYLTNVMNFMVTGPVNLKNLVATGNANAGLALTGAAASILSSGLTPSASTTTVKVNASNVISMVGGIVTLGVDLATDGAIAEITPALEKRVDFWGTAIGDTLSAVGSGLGGLHTPDTTSTGIPSRFISYTTTIGNLANSGLQDQMGIAFDTKLDSFLGDWGKLSILGPKITNNTDPTYYSPDQVSQDAAVRVLSQASQRSFYMSLLPNFYGVYFFPGFAGVNSPLDFDGGPPDGEPIYTNQPDMGSIQNTGNNTTGCAPFFMPGSNQYGNVGNTAPALGFVWTPTAPFGQSISQLPWGYTGGLKTFSPTDYYVIASYKPSNPQTTQTSANFMSDALAQQLFSSSGFNIPLDLFVDQYGPMQSSWFDINTGTRSDSPLGFLPPEMCRARNYTIKRGNGVSLEGAPPASPSTVATSTTLTAPASVLIGQNAALQAQVNANGTPMTTGNIIFLEDKQTVGSAAVDATGSASFTLSGLAIGAHTVQALYQPAAEGYAPSESSLTPLMVYADSADLALSLSAPSLSVTYGTTSSSVKVQIQSLNGMAGDATLSCSGLPVGMVCNFNPGQASLAVDSTFNTAVTITSSVVKASNAISTGTAMMCILPASFLLVFGVRKGRKGMQQLFCLGVLAAIASALAACGGSSSPKPFQETGAKTILINVTCGPLTKSIPLVLNIH